MPINGQSPHNAEDVFDELIAAAVNNVQMSDTSNRTISSDRQLSDCYFYEHEKARSESISLILGHYEVAYKKKVVFQGRYRTILFWGCSIIIISFVVAVLKLSCYVVYNASSLRLQGLAGIMTALISLIVSVLKLVETITKYCFPENDDKHIINIVDSIQNIDLKRMMEHNRTEEARKREFNLMERQDNHSGQ